MNIIKKINVSENYSEGENGYSGVSIDLEEKDCWDRKKQQILLLIADDAVGGSCCENSGYLLSEDNIESFIGALFYSISVTNEKLETTVLDFLDDNEGHDRSVQTIFVNIDTSKGLLQFTAYNEHNGYYGHRVIIRSKDYVHEEII
jgi:hypothetical protein